MATKNGHSATGVHKRIPYALTEAQVETLAAERTRNLLDTDKADGTYLSVILHHTQGKLGPLTRGRKPNAESQLAALQAVATLFYGAVLRGVTTEDIAIVANLEPAEITRRTRERNRRAVFARTAKSTLVTWAELGGDLRALDPATVTKSELRTSIAAARDPEARAETSIERAQRRIIASVTAQARASPEEARARLEAVIAALTAALDELPETEEHTDTTTVRTRVGVPSFREPRVLNRAA